MRRLFPGNRCADRDRSKIPQARAQSNGLSSAAIQLCAKNRVTLVHFPIRAAPLKRTGTAPTFSANVTVSPRRVQGRANWDAGRAKGWMSGEVQLFLRGKISDTVTLRGALPRLATLNESGFREVELPGNRLICLRFEAAVFITTARDWPLSGVSVRRLRRSNRVHAPISRRQWIELLSGHSPIERRCDQAFGWTRGRDHGTLR